MELVEGTTRTEKTIEERHGIAREIYDGINAALHHLLTHEGLDEGHSSVVELRREQKIAGRALNTFEDSEELMQAA